MSDISDFQIRPVQKEDRDWLAALWNSEFGDSEAFVHSFLDILPRIGFGLLAEYHGERAAAAYAITGMTLESDGETHKVSYFYAVATKTEFRNRGIASALCRELKKASLQENFDLILVKPDGENLFPFYQKAIQTSHTIRKNVLRFFSDSTLSTPAVKPVSAAQYLSRRDALLSSVPHLALTEDCILLEKRLCQEYGGDLYCISDFPAAIYRDNETGLPEVKELVATPENVPAIMNGICSFFHSESAILNSYADREDGIPYLAADRNDIPKDAHWGILFD